MAQEALAAKVLGSMFLREDVHSPVFFEGNALMHMHDIEDDLREDDNNADRCELSRFLEE